MVTSLTLDSETDTQLAHDNFSDRIEMLLNSRGCSKSWLARELGISKQALNHVLKIGKKPKFVSELALIFNVNPKWLLSGQGKIYIKSEILLKSISLYKLTEILFCDAISKASCIDKILFNRKNEHQYFAILFENYPSMSTKFAECSILIFDQDLTPQNGSYVLVALQEEGIVFRQFYKEKMTVILKPSDVDYDSIKCTNCTVLGTLVETRVKF